jgi:hypothetical protein
MATAIKKKRIIKDIFKYGIPLASLGVGAANLSINMSRKKKDRIYHEQQLKAMKELTDSLNRVNSCMSNESEKTKSSLPEKQFSLRDDSGIKFRRKVDLEGLLGDNKINELRDWLLEKSSDPRFQVNSEYSTENFLEEVGYSVSINKDPRKSVVNLLYSNGILEILFVNPRLNEISKIDKVLDEYQLKYNNEVGYIATQPAHSIFHVEIELKKSTESEVPDMLNKEGFKINVLINKNK